MKIICISDTHGKHGLIYLEQTDILLFAGDAMTCGYKLSELKDFLTWFSIQPANHKIMVAGNHDRWIENNPKDFRELLKDYPDIIYLEDEFVVVDGLKIYGTPHTKVFYNWAFNRTEDQLTELFAKIPNDIHILVSHAPQRDVLDRLMDNQRVGELPLQQKMWQLRKLKLHVFGHLHDSFGLVKPYNKYVSVNASQVDEEYRLKNFPIIVNIQT
jgi:predicted phosphohydrolase